VVCRMRILQANKFFFPNGGSETVFFLTRDLLVRRGHSVVDFAMADERNLESPFASYFAPGRMYSEEAGLVPRVRAAGASVYSLSARRQLSRLLDDHPCDVAHLHLIYHQLTMSLVDELASRHIPIVMTAHDYKAACPAYTLFRDGKPCRRCVGGSPRHVISGRCVKASLAASGLAFVEAETVRARHLYDKVDHWIAPSGFAAEILSEAGTAPERISVIPNFIPDSEIRPLVDHHRADSARFLYAGRLEPTKGVDLLLRVFSESTGELGTLIVAGATGSLVESVERAASSSPFITYLGRLSREEVQAELSSARAAVLPAQWEENNPLSLLEARAVGTAVICSDRGGLPEMVTHMDDGLLFPAAESTALRDAIATLARDPELAHQLGLAGHERLLRENTADVHYNKLLRVYERAIEHGTSLTRVR
jgi:glycosyltransferase involved in cell wall biosynthesis